MCGERGGSAFGGLFWWIPASVPSGLRRNDEGGVVDAREERFGWLVVEEQGD